MQETNENEFMQLAETLCELLGVDAHGRRIVAAQALKQAYTAGVLAGVDLAATGMMLVSMLDAEDPQNASSTEERPVYAGPSIDLHDHPSPREAMAAAGWCPKRPTSS